MVDAAAPWIVYLAIGDDGSQGSLQRLRPDTGAVAPALPSGPAGQVPVSWAPDGSRFVFTVPDTAGVPAELGARVDVWTAAWDGTGAALLVDCTEPCWALSAPDWSPDGSRIAFSRDDVQGDRLTASRVQVLDLASGEITTVAEVTAPQVVGGPRWSPDGRRLLIGTARRDDPSVAAILASGSAVTDITMSILDVDAASPTPEPVLGPEADVQYADWHPADDLIVYAAGNWGLVDPSQARSELFTIRPDGTDPRQVTDVASVGAAALWPTWSGDGSEILFTLWHRGSSRITLAKVRGDGSGLEELGGATPVVGALPCQRPVLAKP